MLRRLVRRFNEEGGAGAGGDAAASSSQNGGTSTNAVTEIELDIDSGEVRFLSYASGGARFKFKLIIFLGDKALGGGRWALTESMD